MNTAILRTEKLATLGNVAGSAEHVFRERQTLNANAALTPSNTTNGAASSKEVLAALKDRLETVPTVRKNAVLAIEYFIGASPEFFRTESKAKQEAYFDQAEKWLHEKHGSENVITATRHYDETSPHLSAIVVPVTPTGKLSASHFLDGRARLSQMQTDFAEKVGAPYGLQRGIEGSKAKHATIASYYANLQAPTPKLKTKIPEVPEPTIAEKLSEKMGIETAHSAAVIAQQSAKQQQAAEFKEIRKVEQAKAKQYDLERAGNAARNAALAKLRESAVLLRQIPLASVLERLGATPDPADKKNWRTAAGRMTVEEPKFFCHDAGKGGGGAIDLVMLLHETDYKGAVQWLAGEYGTGAVVSERLVAVKKEVEEMAAAPKLPFSPPAPEPKHWPRVRDYLTKVRCISSGLVERLNRAGKVYADQFANAIFLLNSAKGVELRGTGEKPFHGIRGEKTLFSIKARDADDKRVAVVESAIEAISLCDLGTFGGRIVSTSGNSSKLMAEKASEWRAEGLRVVGAQNNDKAGDAQAKALGLPIERLRPNGKDWNDDLRAKAEAEAKLKPAAAPAVSPTQEFLEKLKPVEKAKKADSSQAGI